MSIVWSDSWQFIIWQFVFLVNGLVLLVCGFILYFGNYKRNVRAFSMFKSLELKLMYGVYTDHNEVVLV